MTYEVFIEILKSILMIFGGFTLAMILYYLICELKQKIKKIMHRQSKIRCLCKHEYILKWRWYYGMDLDEYCYLCRKCGKRLDIKVAKEEELQNE